MRLFPSLSEDSSLFRVLLVLFVPSFFGAAVATRAYALPLKIDTDAAAELVRGLPARSAPSPWMRISLSPPSGVVEQVKHSTANAKSRRIGPALTERKPAKNALLVALATEADGLTSMFSPSSDQALDAALNRAGKQDQASVGLEHLTHVTTSRDQADVSVDLDDGGSARADTTTLDDDMVALSENALPTRRTWRAEPEQTPTGQGDAAAVRGVLGGLRGSIESCGQQAGKLDPELAGRLSLAWTIESGRVQSVRVAGNETGNTELGQCVARVVRRAQFDAELNAEIAAYTWIFAAQ